MAINVVLVQLIPKVLAGRKCYFILKGMLCGIPCDRGFFFSV